MSVARAVLDSVQGALRRQKLGPRAAEAKRTDLKGLPAKDIGADRAIDAGIAWLGRTQDLSKSRDGGSARHFSLIDGWSASYPETSGYIVETLVRYADQTGRREALDRARRMLDWLVAIQYPEGSFQGGMIDQTPKMPVTFNTGQILIGLAAGAALDKRYLDAMRRAADWLVETQEPNGSWQKYATPFARPGDKVYETHVSRGLFDAHAIDPTRGYLEAGMKQVDWALTHQKANGWLASCCLSNPERPLTHTLGYALRGIVSAYLASKEPRYLDAARLTADALLAVLGPDGKLRGRFDQEWRPTVNWVCLTGSSQIAECWLLLHRETGSEDYLRAGLLANSYVRRTITTDRDPDTDGGVKGSFPVNGLYGQWQYLNWACKFTIDANLVELEARGAKPNFQPG